MRTKIWLALVSLYLVWGSTYLAIRFAVETIPPFLMAGTRFLISGVILYAWRRAAGDPAPSRRQWRSAVIVGLLLLVGGNGLVSWAEQHVASGIAALMVASIPLWMVLIEALRRNGTRPDWKIMLGLVIGFGGLVLLVSESSGISAGDGLDLGRPRRPTAGGADLVLRFHLQPGCGYAAVLTARHGDRNAGRGGGPFSGRDDCRRMAGTAPGGGQHEARPLGSSTWSFLARSSVSFPTAGCFAMRRSHLFRPMLTSIRSWRSFWVPGWAAN